MVVLGILQGANPRRHQFLLHEAILDGALRRGAPEGHTWEAEAHGFMVRHYPAWLATLGVLRMRTAFKDTSSPPVLAFIHGIESSMAPYRIPDPRHPVNSVAFDTGGNTPAERSKLAYNSVSSTLSRVGWVQGWAAGVLDPASRAHYHRALALPWALWFATGGRPQPYLNETRNHKALRTLMHLRTGSGHLRAHSQVLGSTKMCHCGQGPDTTEHLLFGCELLAGYRASISPALESGWDSMRQGSGESWRTLVCGPRAGLRAALLGNPPGDPSQMTPEEHGALTITGDDGRRWQQWVLGLASQLKGMLAEHKRQRNGPQRLARVPGPGAPGWR